MHTNRKFFIFHFVFKYRKYLRKLVHEIKLKNEFAKLPAEISALQLSPNKEKITF